MSAENPTAYSREQYERNEADIESSIDAGARAAELAPKFAEQETLKNEAWNEALVENKERDQEKAAELLKNMESKAEVIHSTPEASTGEVGETNEPTDAAMAEFVDTKSMRDIGNWHGTQRAEYLADKFRSEQERGRKDRVRDVAAVGVGIAGIGGAGAVAALEGVTAIGLGAAGGFALLGAIALGTGGYSIYKQIKSRMGQKKFEKKFGPIDRILARAK